MRMQTRTTALVLAALLLLGNLIFFVKFWFNLVALPSPHSSSGSSRIPLPPFAAKLKSNMLQDFTLITKNVEGGIEYSDSHCSLSTLNPDAWKTSVCSFKNVCYDPKLGKFALYYHGAAEVDLEEIGVNLGRGNRLSAALIQNQTLPVPRFEPQTGGTGDKVWVLAELSSLADEAEYFLRDDLFAWWLLNRNSIWDSQRVGVLLLSPPTSSSSQSAGLSPVQRDWFHALFGASAPILTSQRIASLPHPICFPQAAAGLGSMTDHCSAPIDHEFHLAEREHLGVYFASIPCSIGRMSLFAEMKHAVEANLVPARSIKSELEWIDVLFLLPMPGLETELDALYHALSNKQGLVVERVKDAHLLPPARQVELAQRTKLCITLPSGPSTALAHFLPPGSAVLLLQSMADRTFKNFAYWNNLGYVRAHWLDVNTTSGVIGATLLETAVALELEKSRVFLKKL